MLQGHWEHADLNSRAGWEAVFPSCKFSKSNIYIPSQIGTVDWCCPILAWACPCGLGWPFSFQLGLAEIIHSVVVELGVKRVPLFSCPQHNALSTLYVAVQTAQVVCRWPAQGTSACASSCSCPLNTQPQSCPGPALAAGCGALENSAALELTFVLVELVLYWAVRWSWRWRLPPLATRSISSTNSNCS